MTNIHSTSIRLSSLLLGSALTLALTLLPACKSPTYVDDTAAAETPPAWARTDRQPVSARPATAKPATAKPVPASAGNNIDRAYLHALQLLDEERKQAMEDARTRELNPAQMLELTQSFETRRQNLTTQWQQARPRQAAKGSRRSP